VRRAVERRFIFKSVFLMYICGYHGPRQWRMDIFFENQDFIKSFPGKNSRASMSLALLKRPVPACLDFTDLGTKFNYPNWFYLRRGRAETPISCLSPAIH